MKIIIAFIFFALPCLCFSQKKEMKNFGELPEPPMKRFEVQVAGGMHINNDNLTLYGTETNFYYQIEEGFFMGAGLLFANNHENNFIVPNASLIAQFNTNKIAPYVKIASGPNFSSQTSSGGLFFAIGGGAEYKLNNNVGLTADVTLKSFSYTRNSPGIENSDYKINYSYFAPYVGVTWKF